MEDSEEYDKLIRPLMLSFRICGCWPLPEVAYDTRSMDVRWHRIHRQLVLLLLFISSCSVTCEVIVYWGEDMNETIECSLVTSAFYLTIIRMIIFSIHQKDMQYIFHIMRRDWTSSNLKDRDLIKNKTRIAFKIAKIFIVNVAITGMAFIVLPAFELKFYEEKPKKILPYRGYYFFNFSASPTLYKSAYVVNSILGIIACSTIAAATSFSLITTMHGAAKFMIVQKKLLSLSKSDWTSNKKIGKCVKLHQECIRYATTVERTINILALAQFVVSTGLVCFAGFQLTTMLEDKSRLTKYASFINAAILELFIFSYSGQCLKKESEDIAEYAYASEWIGSVSSSNFKLIAMRSRKSCTITAGKFYDMSHESFLKVMSSSFSYFTVLLAIQEE